MVFAHREEAAWQLAERLAPYRGKHPLVLAIPRGAVPMAKIIADALEGDLDVILVRKLGAPGNPEYAIGSVDESGTVTVNPDAEGFVDASYIESEKRRQTETMQKRRELYTPVRPPIDPRGRIVIIVDDGVATGSTMIAALRALRCRNPAKCIVAIGVAPPETVKKLQSEADDVVCLLQPLRFLAVGEFYEDFPQVDDEEVVEILTRSPKRV